LKREVLGGGEFPMGALFMLKDPLRIRISIALKQCRQLEGRSPAARGAEEPVNA